MSSASRAREYERLVQELQGAEYQELLQRFPETESSCPNFGSWRDVILFMRKGRADDSGKDAVLRWIFREHREDQDPRWRTALSAIFWPGLMGILRKKARWDMMDPDELWQRIYTAFLAVIRKLDVEKRADRLAIKIINDTVHRTYEEYRREWSRTGHETLAGEDELARLAGAEEWNGFEAVDARDVQDREIRRLQYFLHQGLITATQFCILLATRMYGQNLAEWAARIGITYEAAKKRKQRAEKALREAEEKTAEIPGFRVPE